MPDWTFCRVKYVPPHCKLFMAGNANVPELQYPSAAGNLLQGLLLDEKKGIPGNSHRRYTLDEFKIVVPVKILNQPHFT